MEQAIEQTRPAKIIRYGSLNEENMPGLLSFYEQDKNILHIDRELAATLPEVSRHRLEMTETVFTRLSNKETGLGWEPYPVTIQ